MWRVLCESGGWFGWLGRVHAGQSADFAQGSSFLRFSSVSQVQRRWLRRVSRLSLLAISCEARSTVGRRLHRRFVVVWCDCSAHWFVARSSDIPPAVMRVVDCFS
jgi:hypothetical protein